MFLSLLLQKLLSLEIRRMKKCFILFMVFVGILSVMTQEVTEMQERDKIMTLDKEINQSLAKIEKPLTKE